MDDPLVEIEGGTDERYWKAIDDTRLFKGLPPELIARLSDEVSEVRGNAGKVLTRHPEIGVPTENRLIMPAEEPLLVSATYPHRQEVLGTFPVEPGDTILEGSWTDGIEDPRDPALAGPPSLRLRLEESATYFVLDPLRQLRTHVPGLGGIQICHILANVGGEMSHRLLGLNEQITSTRRQHGAPSVPTTNPRILEAITRRTPNPVSFQLPSMNTYTPRKGTVTVVEHGGFLVEAETFEREDGTLAKQTISGLDLQKIIVAKIDDAPTLVFPGQAMDGVNRHVALVGGSRSTLVREYPLDLAELSEQVAIHAGLVRVITGQAATMAGFVRSYQTREERPKVSALFKLMTGRT
ncbi:hypothetical protein A3J23_03265 [Candidatus Peregrinibacteria bacterium RIFCSPLOWO2_02_FULL_48_14]|nr:MAG: hypothetical protein A2974_01075 [Candidatus Peregrinibacteria bacterium RIFCSPLOWO2_01_FULL_48_20]OGJ45199.1 MAG: hypothetical protein A3J23_03265 [Candidatus Peregrinibacteria bacterium RIFCSPLOWO2_02_FULL_48_14]